MMLIQKLLRGFDRSKPGRLKDYLKIKIEDKLVPIDMPHVGAYHAGARTKTTKK